MKINSDKLQAMIRELEALGFDFDPELLGDDKNGLINNLKDYYSTDEDIDWWLLIRELGVSYVRLDGKSVGPNRRYSKNTSSVLFEQYFLSEPLSYIFEELKRITNGNFDYEVIREFGSTEKDEVFWKQLDEIRGAGHFDCEYIIGGKPVNIRYDFSKHDWTDLNPKFLTNFINEHFDYLKSLNINYLLPEDFITFFCIKKAHQRLLTTKPNIFINEDLSFEQIQEGNQTDTSPGQPQKVKSWWAFWK